MKHWIEAYTYQDVLSCPDFVKTTLINSGFVPNVTKSIWIPCERIIWLGIEIDTNNNILSIASSRITSILNKIEFLTNKIYVSARELSELAGKNNIKIINKRFIKEYKIPSLLVYSDASNSGLASVYKEKGKGNICYKSFSNQEKFQSSTWRELEAIRFSLNSSKNKFENKTIFWYTDNYACSLITRKGSNKPKLHDLALEIEIHKISSTPNIDLNVCWIPREENKEADKLSKQVNYDDWFITKDLVKMLTNKWGKVTIDRFASHTNKKTQRFNSKYICPGSEGVNAYSVDWSKENNLLVPPVYLIPKTIKHFMSSKYSANAILVCPYWPSSTLWPLLFKAEGAFQSFIKDVFVIEDVSKYIELGNYKESLIGSDKFQGSFIAFQLIKRISLFFRYNFERNGKKI